KAIEAGEIQMAFVALDADFLVTKKVIELARQKGLPVVEVDTMKALQVHLEKQQREANELVRVESKRMESRWEQFLSEDARKWKNFEADALQRLSVNDRRERELREQIHALEEDLERLGQELSQTLRVQLAQSEAIKKWPLTWLEEVEKAIEQNPNRRRQPALVPVREE
ncbi:MAG TPA: hypothetical protein PKJ56_07425, partial [Promineifilum sp.]|nr:hypothetical protein [Promineifilum sp.]